MGFKWEPLLPNFLKLNVDGIIFFYLQKARVGVIVRDPQGSTILVASLSEKNVHYPKAIESIVILRGLQLCLHQGIPNLVIARDCLLLFQAIMSSIEPLFLEIFSWILES